MRAVTSINPLRDIHTWMTCIKVPHLKRTSRLHFLMEVELEGKETDLTKKLQELGALEISKVEA